MRGNRDPLAGAEVSIRRVYSYAAYWLGDGAEAEDATSEVFENALRYRASYDPRKGEPIAWLMGIARRTVKAALAARSQTAAEVPDLPATADLESETIERLTMGSALATLGEHDRELLALRYGADLRARQIGELLGIRTNAVEVAIHRAIARLRAELERQEGGLGATTAMPDADSAPEAERL
jgi:RNA polymerase sigma factor (sigma-70 family)